MFPPQIIILFIEEASISMMIWLFLKQKLVVCFKPDVKLIKMKYFYFFLIVLFFFSCSSSNDKILKEATNLYNESLAIEEEVLPKFEELEQISNSINIQGRALTEEEIKTLHDSANIDALQ